MSTDFKNVMAYLCYNRGNPQSFSKARLAKMVYLADWKSCIETGTQITSLKWFFDHYGPYLKDIPQAAKADERFVVDSLDDCDLISLKKGEKAPVLPAEIAKYLDGVLDLAASMPFGDFIRFVYGTYPISSQPKYTHLDLESLAKEYKAITQNS